jgi:hypothetical protein
LFGARAAFALVALLTNSLKGDKLWSVQYRANFQRLGFYKEDDHAKNNRVSASFGSMDAERFVVRMERYLREVGATG